MDPVVRGITAGGIRAADRDHLGLRVVDHFSRRVHDTYEDSDTLELLDPTDRDWPRSDYRPGDAEAAHVSFSSSADA